MSVMPPKLVDELKAKSQKNFYEFLQADGKFYLKKRMCKNSQKNYWKRLV